MTKLLTGAVVIAAALFAVPRAARADIGIRAGLEAPLVTHVNDVGSYGITDSIQPAIDLLVLKGPTDFFGFGLEGRMGFAGTNNYTRTGTSVGPAIILNIPVLPLYLRGSVPIHLEPGDVTVGVRVATGLKFSIPVVGIYLELAADLPLAGNNVSAFSSQQFSLGAGVEIRL